MGGCYDPLQLSIDTIESESTLEEGCHHLMYAPTLTMNDDDDDEDEDEDDDDDDDNNNNNNLYLYSLLLKNKF